MKKTLKKREYSDPESDYEMVDELRIGMTDIKKAAAEKEKKKVMRKAKKMEKKRVGMGDENSE